MLVWLLRDLEAGSMSKRPPGGPDSYSEEIAGWNRHAAYHHDHGGDAAGSDEVCVSCGVLPDVLTLAHHGTLARVT